MLTNSEKAVLFLLSLNEEAARPIVSELSEDEIRKLRAVASAMREVPSGAVEDTFRDFLARSSNAIAVPRGGLPYLRRLSTSALGEERARQVFEDGVASPLARLEHAPPDAVTALLENEPPQMAAAILVMLDPKAAATILASMPAERQTTVVRHVSQLTELPARVVDDVAAALANELPTSDATTLVSVDGIAKAAELLNAAGKETSTAILSSLEAEEKELAMEVRQAMFTFEDLVRLDPRAMRELLREVPSDRLTLALKGASTALLNAVFAGLSSRAADLMKDDLELLGKVRKSEVEAARKEIVEAALKLEADGRIQLRSEES